MKKYILTILILTVSVGRILATAQVADILIYNNDTLSILDNPLEQLSDIYSLRLKLFGNKTGCITTACERKYIAEWTIIDNQLYLTGIYSCCYFEDKIKSDLKQLFGKKFINGKVKADWVTANISSPQGKLLYYVHSGYESLYEKEVVFEIVDGQLKTTTSYDNSKSKISIYSQEANLLKFIYTNIQWDSLPKHEEPIRVIVKFSANEQGIVDSVKVMKGFDRTFDNEAIRVVKSIPEWDVFYRRGQLERRVMYLPIVFSKRNRQAYKQN